VPAPPASEAKATVPESTLRVEMNGLQEQADHAKAPDLYWKPLSWLGTIRPTSANDALDPALWTTFVSTTLGLEVPVLSSLPAAIIARLLTCGCKKHYMDFHGDHTATCTAHSGANKARDWMVGVLGPLFRTAGHTVRTQHGVTASAGRRGDEEIRNYLQDAAGRRSLVFDLSITRERFGSSNHVHQNGLLSHPQDLDAPLRLAAQRKTNSYKQQYAANQNIFSPPLSAQAHACMANFCVFSFYRPAGRPRRTSLPLECHRNSNQSDSFHFKRAAFYQSLKSKVGLAAAKPAALRINLNIEGCGLVAAPVHAPSRAPLLLPLLLLSHNLPLPRVHSG
jgi:hypothetical protein